MSNLVPPVGEGQIEAGDELSASPWNGERLAQALVTQRVDQVPGRIVEGAVLAVPINEQVTAKTVG